MNQEQIIVAKIRDEMRVRPHSLPEDYAGAVIIALEEEGYTIHKDDPSMVYVPREPTEEMVKAGIMEMCALHPDHIEPVTAVVIGQPKAVYRAMISAVTKE